MRAPNTLLLQAGTSTAANIRLVDDAEFDAAYYGTDQAFRAFRNRNYIKRDYECTNVVACVAAAAPADHWEPCDSSILKGLAALSLMSTDSGMDYRLFGHL